jgi:rSAM/selenodomain-associated transferase 1
LTPRTDRRPVRRVGKLVAAVMAKQPVPGRVKTRLCPPLSPEQAAGLAAALLADALSVLAATPEVITAIAADGEITPPPGFLRVAQRGDGLSARIPNAAADLLDGADGVLLFGADTLGLSPADLAHAAALLAAPGDRVVLGPSQDGGYWLIGLKAPHPELFQGMRWSHARVLDDQLAACARQGPPVAFTATRADCDGPEDLARAAAGGGLATRAMLAGLPRGATIRA